MGKGDRKTAKGKRNISSYGNARSAKPATTKSAVTKSAVAAPKAAVKKAPAKKAAK
jgi:30S ribosomal protein S31